MKNDVYGRMIKTISFMRRYLFRNQMILNDSKRKTTDNCVNLHWWSPVQKKNGDNTKKENLGDYLALPIFHYMLERHGISRNTCHGKKHLYSIGSIIFMGMQNAVIWGSGLLYHTSLPFPVTNEKFSRLKPKLDIRAVRGPMTRRVLNEQGYECPEVYGDPAILMPLIYQPKRKKKYEYSIIHHMYSKEADEGISIMTTDYKAFIDRIAESKLIISGSLHGIILAEAYGVPAILLKDRQRMDLFKYKDYYYGTGRIEFPVAVSVEEALKLQPAKLPQLTGLQQGLINAFPVDLWR